MRSLVCQLASNWCETLRISQSWMFFRFCLLVFHRASFRQLSTEFASARHRVVSQKFSYTRSIKRGMLSKKNYCCRVDRSACPDVSYKVLWANLHEGGGLLRRYLCSKHWHEVLSWRWFPFLPSMSTESSRKYQTIIFAYLGLQTEHLRISASTASRYIWSLVFFGENACRDADMSPRNIPVKPVEKTFARNFS